MKTGIFYGSSTGTTAKIAKEIGKALGVDEKDIHNVGETAPSVLGDYELLIMGTPTWGAGDVQDDWYDFLAGAECLDLQGKKMALFGLGDETMTDSFCSGLGEIYRRLKGTSMTLVGAGFPADVYDFHHTDAVTEDGQIVGLLLDNVNRPDITDKRVAMWLKTFA